MMELRSLSLCWADNSGVMRTATLRVLAAALVAGACSTDGDSQLSAGIAARFLQGDGTALSMADLAPFEWERLYVFAPYSMPEQIDRELGFACPPSRRADIEHRDDVSLLLFVSGQRVTRHLAHKRGKGDFAVLHRVGGYSRAEAVFVVDSSRGWPRLVWRAGGPTRG
jgi:hypothetical protein